MTYTSVTAQLVGPDDSAYSAEVGAGVVDKTGKTEYAYTVSAPAGQYNLNVTATTAAGIAVNRTAVVNLTGDGQTQNINLPNGQARAAREMKQETFTDIEYICQKKTKREEFLESMEEIIPWEEWIDIIAPYYPRGKRGRPPM